MRNHSRQQQSTLTACLQCHEPCSFSHSSRKQHTKITQSSLEQKLCLSEWKQQKEKIIQSLEKIVDEIRDCIERVEQSFEDYIVESMLCSEKKLSKKDEKMFFGVLQNVWDGNYDDISCDQLDQLLKSLNNSPSKNKLNQKFSLVERKIGSQILDIIHTNLPQQLKRKVQEILDDEIIKIKPHIQQYINKIKSTSDKKLQQKVPQKFHQRNYRDEESRRSRCYQDQSQSEQSNALSFLNSFVSIDRMKQSKNRFSTIVRVLYVIEEQMKVPINGRISTQFLGGDQTGIGIFVFGQSSKIKQGNVLKLTDCRVYSFHGDKQVQFNNNSQIQAVSNEINKVGEYRLSNHARRLYEDNKEQIKKVIWQREDTFMKKKQHPKAQKISQTERKEGRNPPSRIVESRGQNRGKVKIADIKPNNRGMVINGQVLKIYKKQGSQIWFDVGDDTGVVECSVSDHLKKQVAQGKYVRLSGFDCTLDQGSYILLKPSKEAKIQSIGSTEFLARKLYFHKMIQKKIQEFKITPITIDDLSSFRLISEIREEIFINQINIEKDKIMIQRVKKW